jgi:hypothetical protein
VCAEFGVRDEGLVSVGRLGVELGVEGVSGEGKCGARQLGVAVLAGLDKPLGKNEGVQFPD